MKILIINDEPSLVGFLRQLAQNKGYTEIIQWDNDQVEIHLQPFHQTVGEKSAEEEDRAFLEFFTRGIVGLLSRLNRAQLISSPTHQRAFMGVIKNLRDLFSQTLQRDRQVKRIEENEAELKRWIQRLRTQRHAVSVKGAVVPNVELQFVLPEGELVNEEELSIRTQTTKLVLQPGSTTDAYQTTLTDIKGEESIVHPSAEELQGISLHVQEGQVVWEQL